MALKKVKINHVVTWINEPESVNEPEPENKTIAETFEEVRKEEIKEAENVRIRRNSKKTNKTENN